MTKGIFITGTDTGVGKTHVTCGLAAELSWRCLNVGVMKPVETGCLMRRGKLVPKDAVALARSSGVHDSPELINPYRFREPIAPATAAAREGKRIDVRKILRAFGVLSEGHEFMLVEGAGGIMVPLTSKSTFLDLAKELDLPVLIVARPNLGAVNHTLLTVNALRGRSIPIAGICINDSIGGAQGIAERTGPPLIARVSSVPVLATIRHGSEDMTDLANLLFKIKKQPPRRSAIRSQR